MCASEMILVIRDQRSKRAAREAFRVAYICSGEKYSGESGPASECGIGNNELAHELRPIEDAKS
jgi:hypothetical protein